MVLKNYFYNGIKIMEIVKYNYSKTILKHRYYNILCLPTFYSYTIYLVLHLLLQSYFLVYIKNTSIANQIIGAQGS